MKRIPRDIYAPKFQEQALRLHESEKWIVPEMDKPTSVLQGTLNYWIYPSRRGRVAKRIGNKAARDTCHLLPFHSDFEYRLAAFSIIPNRPQFVMAEHL